MNFQTVRDSLGQKDDKGYQEKTEIAVTIRRVKDVEYSKTSGKPGQSLEVELASGEKDWIKFTGKDVVDSPLDHNAENQRYVLKVWPFKPKDAAKVYLYCWIQRQIPQDTQGGPQAPPQRPNAPQGGDVQAQILAMALRIVDAVEALAFPNATTERPTQPSGPNPDHVGDNPPPPDDDDIPF